MPHLPTSAGPVDIVLQGGGIKAIGLVGALASLAEHGITPRQMVATSGGAIVAGLIAAGYTPADLRRIIDIEFFPELLDSRWYTRLPLVGRPFALLWRLGMHPGIRLEERLAELLAARGIRTFADLASQDRPRPLQVIVSDVTARRLLVLPRDAIRFGIDPHNLSVAAALRMSAGIPIIYEPIRLRNMEDGRVHLLVDGGMLSNFPLWVFDDRSDSTVPVVGLRLADDQPSESLAGRLPVPMFARTRAGQLVDYVENLARTMMEAHDRRYLEAFELDRTVLIPTLGISTTQFDLTPQQTEMIYQAGYDAVQASLEQSPSSA